MIAIRYFCSPTYAENGSSEFVELVVITPPTRPEDEIVIYGAFPSFLLPRKALTVPLAIRGKTRRRTSLASLRFAGVKQASHRKLELPAITLVGYLAREIDTCCCRSGRSVGRSAAQVKSSAKQTAKSTPDECARIIFTIREYYRPKPNSL